MSQAAGGGRRRSLAPLAAPTALAVALAIASLILPPLGVDQAAQAYRSHLFAQGGPAIWDNYWFGGHYLPDYSLLSPPLGAALGPRLMGALAVVGSSALFAAIADREWGERSRAGACWFAAAASISLFTGRMTFALGVLVALAAVFALQRGWRRVGLPLAVLVAVASPIASLFLACGAAAWWLAGRGRDGLWLTLAALGGAALLALLFPSGGSFPFSLTSFLPAFLLTLLVLVLVPSEWRAVRIGLLLYALALLASLLLPTPMGGNANRLGVLLLGPILLTLAWGAGTGGARRWIALATVPLILLWQVLPMVNDLGDTDASASAKAAYFGPMLSYLEPRIAARPGRVEVLPLANHWESDYVAEHLPIARGWERQADRRLDPLFYGSAGRHLSAAAYRGWLDRLAISYVAVPHASLDDEGAAAETRLLAHPPSFLWPAMHDADWTIYRVAGAPPMVSPPGRMLSLGGDSLEFAAPRAGAYTVRVRYTPYWSVRRGAACVGRALGGLTAVRAEAPGTVRLQARFSIGGALRRPPGCEG